MEKKNDESEPSDTVKGINIHEAETFFTGETSVPRGETSDMGGIHSSRQIILPGDFCSAWRRCFAWGRLLSMTPSLVNLG